jgi:four helix bundle protein
MRRRCLCAMCGRKGVGNREWGIGSGEYGMAEQEMAEINSYRDLKVWQGGMALAKGCYLLTRTFPKEELFGLVSQIRRASVSIPANIAERNGRENTGQYIQFLRYSQGSLKEVETHLLIACEVGICPRESVNPLLEQADQLGRMLRALIRSLQAKQKGEGDTE